MRPVFIPTLTGLFLCAALVGLLHLPARVVAGEGVNPAERAQRLVLAREPEQRIVRVHPSVLRAASAPAARHRIPCASAPAARPVAQPVSAAPVVARPKPVRSKPAPRVRPGPPKLVVSTGRPREQPRDDDEGEDD